MTNDQVEPIYSTFASDPDLGDLVEMYVDEMPDRIAAIRERLEADDWEGLRTLVHQMKGAAGSYGFGSLSQAAMGVEYAISSKDAEDRILQGLEGLLRMCANVRSGQPA